MKILKGVAGKDHVHIHVEYPPSLGISVLVKKLKGRSSHHLQQESPMLKKRYWCQHFGGVGYGAWSTGYITEKMVQDYLEHHKDQPNNNSSFILESLFQRTQDDFSRASEFHSQNNLWIFNP